MRSICSYISLAVICCVLCTARHARADAIAVTPPTALLFKQYCIDCHGDDAAKGRLRLDQLKPDFSQAAAFADWVKVLDKLSAGEMPPKNKKQPPAQDVQQAVQWLRPQLHAADLARQRTVGRVMLRRLNRTEYEQTVHDLLTITKPLKHLLPDDGSAYGFDDIGSALTTSSQLLENYVEAADVALKATIIDGAQPKSTHEQYSFLKEPGVLRMIGKPSDGQMFLVTNDAYVMFCDHIPYGGGKLGQFRAPFTGRYRISITAFGRAGPATMRVYAGMTQDSPNHLVGHYDLPAEKPTVITFEDELPANSTITILPYRITAIGSNMSPEKRAKHVGLALKSVDIEGPIEKQWPRQSYRDLFGNLDLDKGTIADAQTILRKFVPRAFRRPVSEEEVRPYVALVQSRLDAKQDFKTAIRLGLQAVLCSPRFLFLDEKPGRLDDFGLASRLSYFLWSSMPDDALLALAREQKLSRPEVLHVQVERMLADAKAQRFIQNFTGQWLELRNIDNTTPDKVLYPEFDELLQVSMVRETELFFTELLQHDLSVTNFIDSSFSILNERLAKHYKIDGVRGQEFRRVELPAGSHRGGLLTQGSILKVSANGTSTSPVLRGLWVMRNVMGQVIPPPPPDVPAVEPDIRGAVTIREQLAKHRALASCASCHRKFDPAGFALENFDVIGGWREKYRALVSGDPVKGNVAGISVKYSLGRPVDAADALADGRHFSNVDELKKLLLSDREQVARCVAGKLLTYATGAEPQFADRQAIEDIVARSRGRDLGLRTIIHEVVQSPAFLNK